VSATTILVLYDDACPLCTFQRRALTWLDWFHVLTFVPISSPAAVWVAPHLTRTQLLEAIHDVTPRGQIHRGARCLRYVGMRVPLLLPMALALWIPGVVWVAERVYRWISRNRRLLSRLFGCKEACVILPERKRNAKAPQTKRRADGPPALG
jgi:predicted DCC family thiol-disulfide oxidoreductase YuxK